MKTPEEIIDDTVWLHETFEARKILEDLDAAGYVIVPKEPTEAMSEAVHEFILRTANFAPEKFGLIYKTMIAAKP